MPELLCTFVGLKRQPSPRLPMYDCCSVEALNVAQGAAVLDAGTDKEKTFQELALQEISMPQTVRYFFDFPKPQQVAKRELYEVQWGEGHVYGNVDELDPTNGETTHALPRFTVDLVARDSVARALGMVMRMLPHQTLPKVFVWYAHTQPQRLALHSVLLGP